MGRVLVLGAGMVGMSTAMLLAREGHAVTILERDPEPPPETIDELWVDWRRRGVRQFHQGHFFTARMRQELDRELPDVVAHAERLGARRFNFIEHSTPMTGAVPEPGDERFDVITARRPVMEAAFAAAAASTPGLEIRRGVVVNSLLTGTEQRPGTPHVRGVRTESGEELTADLVVDVTGRSSPLPTWIEALGIAPPPEEREDIGFTYYGRHFRRDDGTLPECQTALASFYGSISVLTLPADNGTWCAGIIGLAKDAPLRALLDVDTWTRVFGALPRVAHWIDAEPVDERVLTMSKMEDRVTHYIVDGEPIATGVVAVGDSWACSNPSLGRGATIGLLHAIALRDALRSEALDDPAAIAKRFEANTQADVQPWYDATVGIDRGRKLEIDANIRGEILESNDPTDTIAKMFSYAASIDADACRDFNKIAGMLSHVMDVFSEPGVLERALDVGATWQDQPPPGPDRAQLLALLEG